MTLFFKYHAFVSAFFNLFYFWTLHTPHFLLFGPFFCHIILFCFLFRFFLLYSTFTLFSVSFPPYTFPFRTPCRIFFIFRFARSFFYTMRFLFYHAYIVFRSNFATPHFRFCPFRHNPSFRCHLFFFPLPYYYFFFTFYSTSLKTKQFSARFLVRTFP